MSSELCKVGIPLGTRLQGLVRVTDGNRAGWQLWIGLRNPLHNVSQWEGTYLLCLDDGSVTRVTEEDGNYTEFKVREA